jgi:hypothetical protein
MPTEVSRSAYAKRNLAWPLSWRGGGFHQVTLAQRYEAALLHLLRTPQGALYYEPDYGSLVYQLRTQNMQRGPDGKTAKVLAFLRMSAAKYIPDIQIIDLISELHEDDQRLKISCVWVIREATVQMHGDIAVQQTTTVLI